MNLQSIYLSNGTGIFLLLILQYASKDKILQNRLEDKVYSFMVIGVMLGCFCEALSYTVDGRLFPGSIPINYIANTYLFTFNLLLPFAVLAYVDLGLYGDKSRIWKVYKPQIIIGAIFIAANIVNFFVPISYYITDQNVYERRPFGYLYYAVILYYCLSALHVTHRYERENGARVFFRVPVFLIPILVGAGLQFMFYGLSLAWLASAIGLVGLFMMQQNELAFIDALSGIYNRQYLNHILSSWSTKDIKFAGAMFDVDNFKSINDKFGHTEGDRALKAMADILMQSRTSNEWAFRFAGDEFIVLKIAESGDDMQPYVERVLAGLDEFNNGDHPYHIDISYGISFFDAGTVDSFMKDMDDKMYKMKARHHAAKPAPKAER